MPIPEYVRTIREKIGTDLLWLPGVAAVVVNESGDVLLGRRADTGEWASLAGILEPGEQPADAIVREIREEAGVDAEILDLLAVRTDEPVAYPNGDTAQYLTLLFLCRYLSGEAHVADDESLEIAWFSPEALPPMSVRQTERVRLGLAALRGDTRPAWQ
ncbi:NUDIX hydrolase OS=Tsukamurella paurometabola (strain ATCC 8368 / DSM / CCUG 35730 / CIP 100753/ JCM 10117 / KCTC 9821 / NBRC 16120 / NCIMB 702349 / NCTC 13040) OX=521096 GN=Tpau_0673 PE=4 SV=1 [Tsukamurella paurometabola]|uniref:NUDIX hydrolase n=1 Tax=Tsukamurella paurometabola (strain ATCC 8368 / DSM 20162 / CCUG 35730 / CIP 100753 / JCM 10117 / KCTC 9821 / NBRC 16120 / NCIMB 702349 / NCTC 13040) TaxID=521096 RepID=D5UT23_TSUPD|nr:NUDIX domain-containing protein [Tsukamurella paurometabola]ADG77310.1 NUDIX hydrolase [Tsukamurella paurometabola DSM 20162]SUP43455.1 Nucleoside triphosphatase nudI [Tsukamurella paurometabola]